MSDLGFNKIAGAVLATGLAIVGFNQVSSMAFEPHELEKAGYAVEIPEDTGAAAEVVLPPDWGTVLLTADVAAGQTSFTGKCGSCHKPTDENGTGPGQNGVVGRHPGSHAGFAYSPAMTAFGAANPQWTYDLLDHFLTNPKRFIDGTKMTFVGLKSQEERINVIAYLHTLNSSLPIPAPDPSRQPQAAAAGEAAEEAAEGEAPAAAPAAAAPAAAAPAAH